MAITPPPQRIWWKEPIARTEIVWIVIAFLWGLLMFSAMIYWHMYGEQNLSNESYRITPELFAEKANAMVEKYQVREEAGFPVVRPPPGSDVYMIARLNFLFYLSPGAMTIVAVTGDGGYRQKADGVDLFFAFACPGRQ